MSRKRERENERETDRRGRRLKCQQQETLIDGWGRTRAAPSTTDRSAVHCSSDLSAPFDFDNTSHDVNFESNNQTVDVRRPSAPETSLY